jgi:hypothetical protein
LGYSAHNAASDSISGANLANFLQNLVARSVDPAPAIRPRLASIFEAVNLDMTLERPAIGDDLLDVPKAPEPMPEPPLVAPQTVALNRLRSTAPQANEIPQAGEPTTASPRRDRRDPIATIVPPPTSALRPVAGLPTSIQKLQRPSEATGALEPAPARPAITPARPTSELADRSNERRAAQPAPEAPAPPNSPTRPTAQRHEATEAPHIVPRTLIERIIERAAPPADRRNTPAAVATQAQPQPRRLPDAVSDQATAAAPTITVTIGRIEVRATTTQAPAKQPRGAPEVMSLDEYLRRRSGGGAR